MQVSRCIRMKIESKEALIKEMVHSFPGNELFIESRDEA